MDILEFQGLGEAEQWEEFWDHCIFLAHYIDIDTRHHLYRLHDFYVELTSDSAIGLYNTQNAFIDGPRLDKYIENDLLYITEGLDIKLP